MTRPIKKASTDKSVTVRVLDSGDGTPETGVTAGVAGAAFWYRRDGAAAVTFAISALNNAGSTHADGGFIHIFDGYCRLDLPDAAFASGAPEVMAGGVFAGMVVVAAQAPLVDYDPEDSVRLGLTALPNAAADALGGLPISDAGGLDIDTKLGYLTAAVATAASLATVLSRLTSARAGYLDKLNVGAGTLAFSGEAATYKADVSALATATSLATALSRLTAARAGYLDKLNVGAGTLANTVNAVDFKADVSALATGASLAAVKTVGDAVQAKTDNLPSDPADQSLVIAATDANLTAIGALNDPTAAVIATAVMASVVETGYDVTKILRLLAAAMAGKLSGAGTATNTIRDILDAKNRITATVDADGNRTAITLDGA